jgi:hypothetical protein
MTMSCIHSALIIEVKNTTADLMRKIHPRVEFWHLRDAAHNIWKITHVQQKMSVERKSRLQVIEHQGGWKKNTFGIKASKTELLDVVMCAFKIIRAV